MLCAAMTVVGLQDIHKRYDDRRLLQGVSFFVGEGERIGLLGPNGCGKSTLLKILAGVLEPDAGERTVRRDWRIGYLAQEPELDAHSTVRAVVRAGMPERAPLLAELERVHELLAAKDVPAGRLRSLLAAQERLDLRLETLGGHDVEHEVEAIVHDLGLPDADAPIGPLSGGERRRVALARLLLSAPEVLLLDEPTNHLDAESVAWLERFLERCKGTVVAVTHDRYFLDNVAGWILELDRGKGLPFEGNYSSWLEQKQARLAVEEKTESARRRTLARELEWVRMSPTARHAKGKARVAAYERLLAEDQNVRLDRVEIHIPAGPRLGDVVVKADHVSKGFGDRLLVEDMT